MQAEVTSVYERLQALLPPPPPIQPSGWFAQTHSIQGPWGRGLRAFSQVIFINHPLSGALLLLAFWLTTPWMALLALIGMTAANAVSRLMDLSPGLRDQGIHGFNGALVGCAGAALANSGSIADAGMITLLVALGGGLTTLILELWRRRFFRRGDPPALTLPFCLITWCLLALLNPASPAPIEMIQPAATTDPLKAFLLGIPHSFGQVFLCSKLASGCLVLLAVVLASPMAAALGIIGAMVGMTSALAQGADPAAVAQGLWGYNSLLVAIALGGIFHTPGVRSLLLALAGAGLVTFLQALQSSVISSLPPLTLSFVLTTWLLQRLAGRALPALIPVSLHAVVTPEEHRLRFRVTSALLNRFRSKLRQRIAGTSSTSGMMPLVDETLKRQTQNLFAQLDCNQDGSLSIDELRQALMKELSSQDSELCRRSSLDVQLDATMAAMDLDGDSRVDCSEFGQLIQQLQKLRQVEERLLLYLMPIDADGNDQLEPGELACLLRSLGQPPLIREEETLVFSGHPDGLSWRQFVDQLLLV